MMAFASWLLSASEGRSAAGGPGVEDERETGFGRCRMHGGTVYRKAFPHFPPIFEQTFKNIDDVPWKDAGYTSELADLPKSRSIDVAEIDAKTWDLPVKNQNADEEVEHRSLQKILDENAGLNAVSAAVLGRIAILPGKEAVNA